MSDCFLCLDENDQDENKCRDCFAESYVVTYRQLKLEFDRIDKEPTRIKIDTRILKKIIEFALKPPWIPGQLTKNGIAVLTEWGSGYLCYDKGEQELMLDVILGDFIENDTDFDDFFPVRAMSEFITMNPGVYRRFVEWYKREKAK